MSKELFEQIREAEFYELFGLDYNDGSLLESLLLTSAIQPELEREIHQRFYAGVLSQEEGERIIEYLKNNQRDPISGGFNYQAEDIKYKLKHGKDTTEDN